MFQKRRPARCPRQLNCMTVTRNSPSFKCIFHFASKSLKFEGMSVCRLCDEDYVNLIQRWQGGTKTPDSLQSSEDAPRNAEENERVKRVSERDRVRSITCVYSRHVSAQKNISLVKQEEGDRHWRIDDHLLGAGQLLTTLFLHARLSKDGKGSEWGFERPVGGEDKS